MEQKFENIFDTHSHYDDDKFDSDRFSLLKSLKGKGVCNVVSCGCDINSTKFNQLLAQKFDFVYFAAGLHPENLEGCTESDIDEIAKIAADEKCVAIGEIGLDYYWMSSTRKNSASFSQSKSNLQNHSICRLLCMTEMRTATRNTFCAKCNRRALCTASAAQKKWRAK